MNTEWHDNALHDRRQWLGNVHPHRDDSDDDDGYAFTWGPDCDAAIFARRGLLPDFDAPFAIAEQDGIAILPAYGDADSSLQPHPLMELAYTCDDTSWIVVTRRDGHAEFTADMLVDSINSVLAPCRYELHNTPTWRIRITHHA